MVSMVNILPATCHLHKHLNIVCMSVLAFSSKYCGTASLGCLVIIFLGLLILNLWLACHSAMKYCSDLGECQTWVLNEKQWPALATRLQSVKYDLKISGWGKNKPDWNGNFTFIFGSIKKRKGHPHNVFTCSVNKLNKMLFVKDLLQVYLKKVFGDLPILKKYRVYNCTIKEHSTNFTRVSI